MMRSIFLPMLMVLTGGYAQADVSRLGKAVSGFLDRSPGICPDMKGSVKLNGVSVRLKKYSSKGTAQVRKAYKQLQTECAKWEVGMQDVETNKSLHGVRDNLYQKAQLNADMLRKIIAELDEIKPNIEALGGSSCVSEIEKLKKNVESEIEIFNLAGNYSCNGT